MKHLFVPYNLALLARDKGFNAPCFAYYDEKGEGPFGKPSITEGGYYDNTSYGGEKSELIASPIYWQLINFCQSKGIKIRQSVEDNKWLVVISREGESFDVLKTTSADKAIEMALNRI